MEYYNKALDYFQKLIGSGNTESSQLDKIGRFFFRDLWSGVFPRDLYIVSKKHPYAIVNTDKSGEPGQHWLAIIYVDRNTHIFYDPFSDRPTGFKSGIKYIRPDLDKEQALMEENCGQRALSFIFVYDQFGKTEAMKI
jgi:hypothetical protein